MSGKLFEGVSCILSTASTGGDQVSLKSECYLSPLQGEKLYE